jgi:hypothetical protein
MKRWKFIRTMLSNVGYTTIDSVSDIVITNIDSNGYIYYTDENGNAVKALYNSTTPIVVNSDTTSIFFETSLYLAGSSAYTYAYSVTNQDGLLVNSETTFTSNNSNIVATGATGTLTAVASGTTTINVVHNDGPSGVTSVTVGPFVDTLSHNPSAITMTTAETYTANQWINSLGQSIPVSQLTLTATNGTISVAGLFTYTATGTTIITATDKVKTSVSGILTVTTTN